MNTQHDVTTSFDNPSRVIDPSPLSVAGTVLLLGGLLLTPAATATATTEQPGPEIIQEETANQEQTDQADEADPAPSLTLSAEELEHDQPLTISYVAEDAQPLNWVAIYGVDDIPGTHDARAWQYVGERSGALEWSSTEDGGWTIQGSFPPGEYVVYLFVDDSYEEIAAPASFTLSGFPADAVESAEPIAEIEDLRVLTWNIYQGGLDDGWADEQNRAELVEYVAEFEPDVLLAIETYGASDVILEGLNNNDEGLVYTGTQITYRGNDNLWIFTHLPVMEVFGTPAGLDVDDFNIGGMRVQLPNNHEIDLFNVWSNYSDPWIGDLIEENAQDIIAGQQPRHDESVIREADVVQTGMVEDFASYVETHTEWDSLAVLGGDFNTVPGYDWSEEFASCESHYGLAYELIAMESLTDIGFTDDYRTARPDACAYPGVTWSPRLEINTPHRIDFNFSRGEQLQVIDTVVLEGEKPGGGYYSDHALVLSDYQIGEGPIAPEPTPSSSDEPTPSEEPAPTDYPEPSPSAAPGAGPGDEPTTLPTGEPTETKASAPAAGAEGEEDEPTKTGPQSSGSDRDGLAATGAAIGLAGLGALLLVGTGAGLLYLRKKAA